MHLYFPPYCVYMQIKYFLSVQEHANSSDSRHTDSVQVHPKKCHFSLLTISYDIYILGSKFKSDVFTILVLHSCPQHFLSVLSQNSVQDIQLVKKKKKSIYIKKSVVKVAAQRKCLPKASKGMGISSTVCNHSPMKW